MNEQTHRDAGAVTRWSGEDARWRAVLGRDASATGAFFYAVRTTGVVCRPGCASRAPRRENVVFYRDLATALRAGFRACRRCRPGDRASHLPSFLVPACRELEREPTLTQAALAARIGVSGGRLRRGFVDALGMTAREYADAVRAGRFRAALGDCDSVLDAACAAGYQTASRMYAQAPQVLGMAPSSYRKGAAGQRVTLAAATCSLGAVGVAATRNGVCAVELGDTIEQVRVVLHSRFEQATIAAASGQAAAWLTQVVRVIDDAAPPRDIPLDIRGTAFQRRVWSELRKVPPGTTLSYAQLAARIDRPRAARAVARACASNHLAVLVPCHRVVRADGKLSGYRWGVARKRALLDAEDSE